MTKEKALVTVDSIIFSNKSRIEDLMTDVDVFVNKYSTDSTHSGMFFAKLEKFVKEYNGYVDNIQLAEAQRKALKSFGLITTPQPYKPGTYRDQVASGDFTH